MSIAYLFPGQGSQNPKMAGDFIEAWLEVENQLAELNLAVEMELYELCLYSDSERIRSTEYTQPTVFATSYSVFVGLRERFNVKPDYVAGHSLGHYTAFTAAGGMSPRDGIQLVCKRGELMARAEEKEGPGAMIAVLHAPPETVEYICTRYDRASVAGYNSPTQTVISGSPEALSSIKEEIQDRTRARFIDLNVSTGFHSPLMEPVAEALKDHLNQTSLRTPSIPIISDVTTKRYDDSNTALIDFVEQVTAPVDWVGVINTLEDEGITQCIVMPPAKELARLVEKNSEEIDVLSIDTPEDAEDAFT